MIKLRKIATGFLALMMLAAPCLASAEDLPESDVLAEEILVEAEEQVVEIFGEDEPGELLEGEIVSESFEGVEDGTDYWELTEYIGANSGMFKKYNAHASPVIYLVLPGSQYAQARYLIASALEEEKARETKVGSNYYAIGDTNASARIEEEKFRIGKTVRDTNSQGWLHVYTLKYPITSGLHRLSFELGKPKGVKDYGNSFMYFYDFEPTDKFYGSTSGFGKSVAQLGFNGTALYFSGNYDPATGKGESWNGVTSSGFGPGTYNLDIIVDADNKRYNFFINGNFVRTASYDGEGIKAFSIEGGQRAFWTPQDGIEAVFTFDNFEQERLTAPTYSLNIEDGVYDVPVETKPVLTFAIPVDKSLVDKIIIYKDGVALEEIERQMSDDATEITFDLTFDYSAEYKFEIPAGNRAVNKAPIIESTVTFRTEHRPTNIEVKAESKPDYVADEEYTATITLANTSSQSKTATYIAALFDSVGRMIDIEFETATIGANSQGTDISVTLPASSETDVTVKTFLVDTLQTMNPLVTDIN